MPNGGRDYVQLILRLRFAVLPPGSWRERIARVGLRKLLGRRSDHLMRTAAETARSFRRGGFRALPHRAIAVPPALDGARAAWCVIEEPPALPVRIDAGVLSFRGWAWSRDDGPGRLALEIENGPAVTTYPVNHRYCRSDLPRLIPGMPLGNYSGFEVSLDRFDLPAQSSVTLLYELPSRTYRASSVRVTAGRENAIDKLESVACDCCGSTAWEKVGAKDGLTLVRCKNCGLVFVSPRPDFARIRQRYSDEYFAREYLPEIQANFQAQRLHWNHLLDRVEGYQSVSPYLFEVGAGAGYLLREANQRGWQASGVELNPSAVQFACSLGLDVVEADILTGDVPTNRYGTVVLESTLEHFVSPRQVLAKCAQALVPGGGCLIWTVGCEGKKFIEEGMAWPFVGPSEHLYYFSAASLARLCESAGLRVDHFWRESYDDLVGVVATKRTDRFV